MKNGAKYVVTTHWGTFSLDEGSYRDYLAGKLWINWTPGKQETPEAPAAHAPANVTSQAIALRDETSKAGVLATLQKLGVQKAIVPYSPRLDRLSIMEMNLTVRSCNGLRRTGIDTFGELKERLMDENALMNIRNIGLKSIKEIKQMFFWECYARLLPYEKAQYWQETLEHNYVK